jgi:hypothetical protein
MHIHPKYAEFQIDPKNMWVFAVGSTYRWFAIAQGVPP